MKQVDEKITVINYDPEWPAFFYLEKQKLQKIFKPVLQKIEHFGSTAIQGVSAKPIIDILVGVDNLDLDDNILDALKTLGYEYLGEAGISGRLAFRKRSRQNFNLAVVKYGSDLWTNNIVIRDFLQNNESFKKKYSKIKKQAIQEGSNTLLAYSKHKEAFLKEILEKAKHDM
jgi:GrpB-like predicted nucleotidyltransferase (UPF0157 family)